MRLAWQPLALADLRALRAYIARRVAMRIRAAVERLADHPGTGRPGRVSGTRELVVTGTPYLVPHRAKGATIEILRVYHGAQRWPAHFEEGQLASCRRHDRLGERLAQIRCSSSRADVCRSTHPATAVGPGSAKPSNRS
jgi:toxin ParE1/3/4